MGLRNVLELWSMSIHSASMLPAIEKKEGTMKKRERGYGGRQEVASSFVSAAAK